MLSALFSSIPPAVWNLALLLGGLGFFIWTVLTWKNPEWPNKERIRWAVIGSGGTFVLVCVAGAGLQVLLR